MLYFKNNDRVYIGSSVDIKQRISSHKSSLKGVFHTNSLLQRDYNVYGEDNLCWKVLEEFDDVKRMLKRESEYILKYKSHIYGYNKTCIALSRVNIQQNFIADGQIYFKDDLVSIISNFFKQHKVKFRTVKNTSLKRIKGYNELFNYGTNISRLGDDGLKSFVQCIASEISYRDNFKFKSTAVVFPTYIVNKNLKKKMLPFCKYCKINKPLEKLYTNKYKVLIKNIFIISSFNPYVSEEGYVKDFNWEFKLFRICRELEEGRFEGEITITVLDKKTLKEFERIQKEVLNERN